MALVCLLGLTPYCSRFPSGAGKRQPKCFWGRPRLFFFCGSWGLCSAYRFKSFFQQEDGRKSKQYQKLPKPEGGTFLFMEEPSECFEKIWKNPYDFAYPQPVDGGERGSYQWDHAYMKGNIMCISRGSRSAFFTCLLCYGKAFVNHTLIFL